MPKGKLKTPVSAPYRGLPKPLNDDVWEKLQTSLPIKLTEDDKAEIDSYVGRYHIIKLQHEDAATVEDLKELKERLHVHSKGLLDIIHQFCGPLTTETDKTLINSLGLLAGDASSDLEDTLKKLQPACASIIQQLDATNFSNFSDSSMPSTTALVDFLKNLKSKAEEVPAKNSPGYEMTARSVEHKRWGVNFGPRAKSTRIFVNITLNTKFSTEQIQYAFSKT
jgi:hypothetical protein